MKKDILLTLIDETLLESLFGFCYARTNDSHEAEELCSEIVYAIVKAGNSDGEIDAPYPFIWRIARNVYADFSEKRQRNSEHLHAGDPEEIFSLLKAEDDSDAEFSEMLRQVYRRIAFLTRAYREVMIAYYLCDTPISEIARNEHTSENTIRQRLFSARSTIRNEVMHMNYETNKPIAIDKIDFVIWGTGMPRWGDPRDGFDRQLSKHIVWLCKKKPRTAREISEELNVPTVYVEEELEILRKGANGKYGLLKKNEQGKYMLNFVLFSKEEMKEAESIYIAHIPMICDVVANFVKAHEAEYLAIPYLNHKIDMNLILWSEMHTMGHLFSTVVNKRLEAYFEGIKHPDRPFTVFGYEDNGEYWGGGCDGTDANHLCGYSHVSVSNAYMARLKKHFHAGHNISLDKKIQLAIRAVNGLPVDSLTEDEKEYAAKAIEEGYLYREGDLLYTKILVLDETARKRRWETTFEMEDLLIAEADIVAKEIAAFLKKARPEHLIPEYVHGNSLAAMPVLDTLVDSLIERGLLTPPENGRGAEGVWMYLEK